METIQTAFGFMLTMRIGTKLTRGIRLGFIDYLIFSALFMALGLCFFVATSNCVFAAEQIPAPNKSDPAAKIALSDKISTSLSPIKTFHGKIGKKPVYMELVSHGVSPAEVLNLSKSFKTVFDFRKARPAHEYEASLNDANKLVRFKYKTGLMGEYTAKKNNDGSFDVIKKKIVVHKETVAKQFTINSSLYNAILGSGENEQLVQNFAHIFSYDIDFYLYPRAGDTIKILFEKKSVDNTFIGYGKILAAQYVGRKKTYSAFLFNDGLHDGYYDQNGHPLKKSFLKMPIKFGVKTSSFSTRRFHPVSKKYKRHTGIDYGAPKGTPIFATGNGKVKFSGWKSGYGRVVIIRHPNRTETVYGHCSRLIAKTGQTVDQGQTIARVGRSGTATGNHVHYEVRVNGKPINPDTIKTIKGTPIAANRLSRYRQLTQARLTLLQNPPIKQTDKLALLNQEQPFSN